MSLLKIKIIFILTAVLAWQGHAQSSFGWQDCGDIDLQDAYKPNKEPTATTLPATGTSPAGKLNQEQVLALASEKTWCFSDNESLDAAMICRNGNLIISERSRSQSRLGFWVTGEGHLCLSDSIFESCHNVLASEGQFVLEPPFIYRASDAPLYALPIVQQFTIIDRVSTGNWAATCR